MCNVIYCKECPNACYVEGVNQYYCERYSVEIEDIHREFCDLDLDEEE